MPKMSASAYARHRGVTPKAVQKAIDEHRISTKKVKGKVVIDSEKADAEWAANTRARRTNGSGAEAANTAAAAAAANNLPNYAQARAIREGYEARLAKLEYEQKAGMLVPADKVKLEWYGLITLARNRLLSVPSKAKTRMPNLTHGDIAVLDELIREALNELARAAA